MDTYKIILDTFICLATIATGVSAVVAVIHYRRHWRDDEVQLVVVMTEDETKADGWSGCLRITNVGKVPVTVTSLEIVEQDVAENFALDIGCAYFNKRLDQGATVEHRASLSAKKPGVALPERFTIRAKWEHAEQAQGCVTVELEQARAARQ